MSTATHCTIGQLARKAQVPTTTVRYYERVGLLVPDDRSQGNYRLYGEASLRRLRFIRAAQSIGFTLDDVKSLLGAQPGRRPSCTDVQRLINVRLVEIEERLDSLRQVKRLLRSSLATCRKSAGAKCCHVIDTLEADSSRSPSKRKAWAGRDRYNARDANRH
jgi:MerR family mercuric resistance operon transcriptional regulator